MISSVFKSIFFYLSSIFFFNFSTQYSALSTKQVIHNILLILYEFSQEICTQVLICIYIQYIVHVFVSKNFFSCFHLRPLFKKFSNFQTIPDKTSGQNLEYELFQSTDNFSESTQSRYQTFLDLSSFTGFLYFAPNILSKIVVKKDDE